MHCPRESLAAKSVLAVGATAIEMVQSLLRCSAMQGTVAFGCFLLEPPTGNFIGEDLRLFPGFRAGWIFIAIVKNKF